MSTTTIIERSQRLSRSRLWQWQRRYFEQAGLSAFATSTVPHYITSNTVIADAYARIVLAYLIDQRAVLDASQPVYLVELGAGSGRFAFLFLRRLDELLARAGLTELRVTYVLTDFSTHGFDAWRAHPKLAPWFANGRLDVARFDAEHDTTITLLGSGAVIAPGTLRNPLVVLANYFFDTIPIDVFTVEDGELFESLVTLTTSTPGEVTDLDDPELIKNVVLSYEDRPITMPYYDDPELDRLLELYRTTLISSAVKLPIGGLRSCQLFTRFSTGRWLLVSGDKGTLTTDALDGQKPPVLAVHGSFSLNVNYHAIGEYFAGLGGELLQPCHPYSGITVVCALVDAQGRALPSVRAAYASAVEEFGPDDYFVLRRAIEACVAPPTPAAAFGLDQLLVLLRLGRSDPRLVSMLSTALRRHLPKATPTQRRELRRLLLLTWANYFHIGETRDIASMLGVIYSDLGDNELALERFLQALAWYGDETPTLYNLALCHKRLGAVAEAQLWINRTLAVNPAHPGALRLRAELAMDARDRST